MKKRLFCNFLVCVLLAAACLPLIPAAAAEPVASGTCGADITWELDANVLTISGSGTMDDFDTKAPWDDYKNDIFRVVISDGIENVGAYAFENYDALEEVDLGSDINTIGPCAFRFCDGLQRVHLPAAFRVFGFECFRECKSLHAIHCDGPFPSFKGSCLWGTTVNIYYPASNPWPLSLVVELENAFSGWIEFLDSDGNDPYDYGGNGLRAERVTATVVSETKPEETEPVETVPETTEAEIAAVEAVIAEPVTEATEPETVPETTEAETEPPVEETTEETWVEWTMATTAPTEAAAAKKKISGGVVGLTLAAGVLFILGVGALIYRISSRNGRYGD